MHFGNGEEGFVSDIFKKIYVKDEKLNEHEYDCMDLIIKIIFDIIFDILININLWRDQKLKINRLCTLLAFVLLWDLSSWDIHLSG